MDLETYNFPFDTCEKVHHGLVAQPYSTLINVLILNMLIIFIYLLKLNMLFYYYVQYLYLKHSILCLTLFTLIALFKSI